MATTMSKGVADLARQVAVDQIAQDIDFNGKLAKKANLQSPALTGTPTAPTAEKEEHSDRIATTAFVHNVVNDSIAVADGIFAAFCEFNTTNSIA